MNRARRSLLFATVLAVLAGVAFVVLQLREAAREREQLEQLFADVTNVVEKGDRQDPELSRLVARLESLDPDDRRVALAFARIDVLRGRFQRAAERLGYHLITGGTEVEERTAAIAYLNWPLRGGETDLERLSMWSKAQQHAENAHRMSGEPRDLFMAWQAASRGRDREAVDRLTGELEQQHPGSLEARTVALLMGAEQTIYVVDQLATEWDPVPIELELARAALLLLDEQFEAAARRFDVLLTKGPNLVELRNLAAIAWHRHAETLPVGEVRDRQRSLRDAQLDWLDANAPADDTRRPTWRAMRGS